MARRWFRFAGTLKVPRPSQPFNGFLFAYVQAMKTEKGLSEATVKGRRFRAQEFLKWFAKKHRRFRTITIDDADIYLFRGGSNRGPVTIKTESGALRAFFRYAEARRWCSLGIADAIKGPLLHRDPFEDQGPKWVDVIRLLRSTCESNPADIRAHALLQLFAVYGLRNSGAHRLQLKDIDWLNKTLTIRRAKREGLRKTFSGLFSLANESVYSVSAEQVVCPFLFACDVHATFDLNFSQGLGFAFQIFNVPS
jgi:integrase/recombinase XerD